jgi:hypothetical protein
VVFGIGNQSGIADTCDVVMKVAMIVANTTVDSLRDIFSMWLRKGDLSLLLQSSLSKYCSGLVLGGNVDYYREKRGYVLYIIMYLLRLFVGVWSIDLVKFNVCV